MTSKELAHEVERLRNKMAARRRVVNATRKDLELLIKCRESGDYAPMQSTVLYNQHGVEYCQYQEIM